MGDECGVCGGDGIADGACDCDENVEDECGVCGGDGSSCAEVVILSSPVAFRDALTSVQQDDLSDSYCAAIAQESGIADATQFLTCTCVQVSANRRRLLSVEYLLSATISQNVLTAQNIEAADLTSDLQSVISVQDLISETPSIVDTIGPVSCDSTGTCEPVVLDTVQSTSGSGGGGGGATVVIILLVLLLGGGGAGYYFYAQNKAAKEMDGIATDKDIELSPV